VGDPTPDNVMLQNGVHVDALTYSWDQFPGFQGTIGDMLKEASASYAGKKFDYVSIWLMTRCATNRASSAAGRAARPQRAGAFGEKKCYVPANTIVNCDFLITVR